MYLTKRDRQIIKFLEEYKSITIDQCYKIFFNKNKSGHQQARKRLKILADNKYIKRFRKDMRSETIYYFEKKLTIHYLKVLDVYAALKFLGVEITFFKREYTIKLEKKNYIADGLIECIFNGYFYPILIESDYTHLTSKKKLYDIYNSSYFQTKYKQLDDNIFPTVIIIRPVLNDNIKVPNDLPFDLIYTEPSYIISNLKSIFNIQC